MARFFSLFSLLLGIWITLLCSLSLTAPLEVNETSHLFRRQDSLLYTIWTNIPQPQKAGGNSALFFPIDQTKDTSWGITYMYGCTGLLISDPDFVIVAHLLQYAGKDTICIKDETTLNKYLLDTLQPVLDLADPTDNTQVEIIYNRIDCPRPDNGGVLTITNWLKNEGNWGVDEDNIDYRPYVGGSGTGEPMTGRPNGLAAITWLKPKPGDQSLGKLQTYWSSDTPIRDQTFTRPIPTGIALK